ncbi:MAG: ribosome silencing factor [bacterium]
MVKKALNFRNIAKNIARLGDEKFAKDIVVFNVCKISSVTDYQIIMGAESHPQLEAIFRNISDKLKESNIFPLRTEGGTASSWVVLDFGGVIVHLMLDNIRRFYSLERLWIDGKSVKWKTKKNVKKTNKTKNR